jgi:hypothetical protein
MGTCVRAIPAVQRRGCTGSHRVRRLLGGRSPQARHASSRRQSQDAPEVGRALGDLDGAFRHGRRSRPVPLSEADPTRGNPGPELLVSPRAPERAPVRSGLEGQTLRTLRPRRDMARTPHGSDPRPHQRQRHGQPPREPADRLPELCCDPRHTLRTQLASNPALPNLRVALQARVYRARVLLAQVLGSLAGAPGHTSKAADAARRAPALRPAHARDRRHELVSRRPQVRRLRQRRQEVGALLRAGARAKRRRRPAPAPSR